MEEIASGIRKVYTYDSGDGVTSLKVYQGSVLEMDLPYEYNAAGQLAAVVSDGIRTTYAYDPFGNETTAQTAYAAAWDNPFRYCGEYWDAETETYYLRARQYDPATGRFLSEDPAQDGFNWYVYCYSNPVIYVDSTGLFGENTQLIYGMEQSPDVVKLQQRLSELGYLDMSDSGSWGTFDEKTLMAVNVYKYENGLLNLGEQCGVVDIIMWEHIGLTPDSFYEGGRYIGIPSAYGRAFYSIVKKPGLKTGLSVGSLDAGIAKIGGDYKYGDWEVSTVNANVALGISADYIGGEIGASLVSGGGGIKLPLLFTHKKLYLGLEGELIGVGLRSYISDGKFKLGATLGVGGSIIIGLD